MKVYVIGDISVVDLPSLKTLLIGVCFKNQDNFNKVLYGCPILEDLHTSIYYTNHFKLSTNEFKTLTKVIRANIDALHVPFKAIPNVRFLVINVRYTSTTSG
jgi:hypothetical protein